MTSYGKSAAALAAYQSIFFLHFGTDMLKPDRNLIALLTKALGNFIQKVGGGYITYYAALPALVLVR